MITKSQFLGGVIISSSLIFSAALSAFQATLEPEASLKKLLEGNERFADNKSSCPSRSEERRLAVVSKQNPFAVIVGCSDSRVSPDLVFDQGVGDLFVVRVAGNVVGSTQMDSIEYGVLALNAGLVFVLGHANCGAVTAVLSGNTDGIKTIAGMIEPSVKNLSAKDPQALEKAIKANVVNSVKAIRQSPDLQPLIAQNKVRVVGGYYHLETGRVEILKN